MLLPEVHVHSPPLEPIHRGDLNSVVPQSCRPHAPLQGSDLVAVRRNDAYSPVEVRPGKCGNQVSVIG